MCGILGEVSALPATSEQEFKDLLALSFRRGPDCSRVWQNERAKFGFNRLAIIDTSDRGMQPIVSPSGRYIVLLNGEIYNYKALQLRYGIANGHLRSGSDVEIVAHLTEMLPQAELVKELNGMFALSVFDTTTNELLLARDFAGIKPLFYGLTDNCLVFASQFDQVFLHPNFKKQVKVSGSGIRDYLELGYMQAPNTVFEGIWQLNPGELITTDCNFNLTHSQVTSYPSSTHSYQFKETDERTLKTFSDIFSEVINDQLIADVPIGTFLSGGIDSPLVTAESHRHNNAIKAFTFNVEHAELSELEKATLYSEHLGTELIVETLKPSSIIAQCDEHFKAYPEPFGDPSSLPTFLLTRLAAKHLTVLLSGDGGDEVFWGYPRFLGTLDNSVYFKYPRASRFVVTAVKRKLGKRVSHAVNAFHSIGEWQLHKHTHLTSDFINEIFGKVHHSPHVDELYDFNGTDKEDTLNWLRWNEFYAHMQRILIKVDRASMSNSMEVRVPFMDKRILDFAWNIQPELGIKHREPKYLLKKAMEAYYPPAVINKVKKGFAIPYEAYLRNELKQDVVEKVLDRKLFGCEFYNESALKKYVNDYLNSGEGSGWGAWIVYALQKWAANYDLV